MHFFGYFLHQNDLLYVMVVKWEMEENMVWTFIDKLILISHNFFFALLLLLCLISYGWPRLYHIFQSCCISWCEIKVEFNEISIPFKTLIVVMFKLSGQLEYLVRDSYISSYFIVRHAFFLTFLTLILLRKSDTKLTLTVIKTNGGIWHFSIWFFWVYNIHNGKQFIIWFMFTMPLRIFGHLSTICRWFSFNRVISLLTKIFTKRHRSLFYLRCSG